VIWHLEQIPRPPQTESRSTPNCRAAVRTGVPTGKLPRLPEGVKITKGSLLMNRACLVSLQDISLFAKGKVRIRHNEYAERHIATHP
jgi:hypothetical protein